MNNNMEDLGKTSYDLVKEYFPNATLEEADFILWERTCFPFGKFDMIKKDLERIKLEETKN